LTQPEGETWGESRRGIAGRARDCDKPTTVGVVKLADPEDARSGGNGILIDGSAGDARFNGSKGCIKGPTGGRGTRRKPSESKPAKPEGVTADASRRCAAGVVQVAAGAKRQLLTSRVEGRRQV